MAIRKCVTVTKASPRIYVNMEWGDAPQGQVSLWIRRAGEPEFAYYDALEVWGGRATFEFDDLLFIQTPGRFVGRLTVAGVDKAEIDIQYYHTTKLVSVENSDV